MDFLSFYHLKTLANKSCGNGNLDSYQLWGVFLKIKLEIYTFQEPTFSWRDLKAIPGARVAWSSRFANFGSKISISRVTLTVDRKIKVSLASIVTR